MKLNINIFKRRVAPFVLSCGMIPTLVGCSISTTGGNSYSITTSDKHDEKLLKPLKKAGLIISEKKVEDNFTIYKLENNVPEYFAKLKPASNGANLYNIYEAYKYSKCCSPIEFKNYLDNSTDISFDDVRNSLNNNPNIEDNIKSIILKGIDNLEKNNFNMDLTVLNYNLSNLKLEYVAKDTDLIVEVLAKFEAIDNTIYINPSAKDDELFEDILIHEVLGHGSNIAYLNKDGGIYCSPTISNIMIEDHDYILGNVVIGKTYEEGLAEYIRYKATNKKIDPNTTSYSVPLYMLLFMCKSCNLSLEDYANNGVEILIDKLQENNLGSVVHFIELLDIEFNYSAFADVEVGWEYNDILYQYLIVYINKKYNDGFGKDAIIKNINSLCNCNKDYMELIATDGYKVVYTPNPNGDKVLAYEYVLEQVYEYVDYVFTENKTVKIK